MSNRNQNDVGNKISEEEMVASASALSISFFDQPNVQVSPRLHKTTEKAEIAFPFSSEQHQMSYMNQTDVFNELNEAEMGYMAQYSTPILKSSRYPFSCTQRGSTSSNAFNQPNDQKVDDVIVDIEEILDMAEPPHSIPSNQPNDHKISNMDHHGVARNKSFNQPNSEMLDRIIIDIEAMLKDTQEPPFPTECCIYRVPHAIRKLKKDAYTPQVVSIGPFHYGNPKLKNMEKYKQIVFKRFIGRTETRLQELVSFVKSSEPRVRACYAENIELRKEKLVKVILVDAIFVIDLLCGISYDRIHKNPWLKNAIEWDLILLENQLPFFFLEELFNREFLRNPPLHGRHDSFLELTFKFFIRYNSQEMKYNPSVSIKHFTDLLRTFHLLQPLERHIPMNNDPNTVTEILYSASELDEAGLKFNVSTKKCLLDLKFSENLLQSVLIIPKIEVEDRTETLFRNLIALEQCHYPYESYITQYIFILDSLINSSKDVDILVHEKIISNFLDNSNAVVKLFNGLGKEIVQMNSNHDYDRICTKLNDFYTNWFKMTTMKQDYFKTPWEIVLSIVGFVLVVITTLNTVLQIKDH